ncbi:MAG: ROK family protein [Clostridia bacterium]|nr:ROK family protein [Clostridia bacterium]
MRYSLGFDIGGTKCAAILGKGEIPENHKELILDKIAFPTQVERGWRAVVDELIASAETLLARNGVSHGDLIGIGVSCGGPLDSRTGTVHCPPNLPDWDNVPLKAVMEERFGVKTVLQNDANACAAAEWRFGAGRGYDDLIFLTFGTGMGAGLILNGQLYSGANDNAGEVGHIRLAQDGPEGYGKRGSFEGFCSGGGIAKLAAAMAAEAQKNGEPTALSGQELTAKTVAIAAKNGDAVARKIYRVCAEKLGLGLSILIDVINPEAVIIGSIYSRDQGLFDDIIKDVIAREALPLSASVCKILPADLGDSIGDYAALSLAFQE